MTFTNKAASEMKERVRALLGETGREMQICTFHSFGLRFLFRNRAVLPSVGLKEGFAIFDRGDSRSLVKEIMEGLNIDTKQFEPSSMLDRISTVKNDCLQAGRSSPLLEGIYGDVFTAYNEALRRQNAVDFDDLLLPSACSHPVADCWKGSETDFRGTWWTQTRTSTAPIPHPREAGGPKAQKTGGGTLTSRSTAAGRRHDQDPNFEQDFPSGKGRHSSPNNRSSGTILGAANALIEGNFKRRKKDQWTARNMGEKITRSSPDGVPGGGIPGVGERRTYDRGGYSYGDMALLYRINAMSRSTHKNPRKPGSLPVVRGTAFDEPEGEVGYPLLPQGGGEPPGQGLPSRIAISRQEARKEEPGNWCSPPGIPAPLSAGSSGRPCGRGQGGEERPGQG